LSNGLLRATELVLLHSTINIILWSFREIY